MKLRSLRLDEIPVGVINLPFQERRRNRVLQALESCGIEPTVIDGVRDKPRFRGCSKGHLAALRAMQGREPFLILEDDVIATEHFSQAVEIPEDCAFFYLGHSGFGTDEDGNGLGAGSDLTQAAGPDHLRVHSMLAAHAIVYVDPAAVEAAILSIEASISDTGLRRHDFGLCELQQVLPVYAVAQPYFVQNDEVQGNVKKQERRVQRQFESAPRTEGKVGEFGDIGRDSHQVARNPVGGLVWEKLPTANDSDVSLLGFSGPEIFAGADALDREPDLQGWNSNHKLFRMVFELLQPKTVIEIGVWKGASVIHMAKLATEMGLQTRIIAIDTWLGSPEHWLRDDLRAELCLRNGFPTLYETFLVNVRKSGFERLVEPLPVPSNTAAHILRDRNIEADVIHIDAGHEYDDVWADLVNYVPMLSNGGILIGDDYTRSYDGVRQAFNKYCRENGMVLQKVGRKCVCAKRDVFEAKIAPLLRDDPG